MNYSGGEMEREGNRMADGADLVREHVPQLRPGGELPPRVWAHSYDGLCGVVEYVVTHE